jgi:hypothetical protein
VRSCSANVTRYFLRMTPSLVATTIAHVLQCIQSPVVDY